MDTRKIVLKETAIVAVGVAVCSAAMVAVFAAFGHFTANVIWGAVAGTALTAFNYFIMSVVVTLAADRAKQGQVKQAKSMIQLSSTVRLGLMAVVLIAGHFLGGNLLAMALPLLFQRPVLLLVEFFRKKGD